jgi:hypothetical protein
MNSDLALIEAIIVTNMRPHFLAVSKEEDYINIVISHPSFVRMTMPERIAKVFDLLKVWGEEVLKNNTVVVQAYCADEMEDLFEFWINDDY